MKFIEKLQSNIGFFGTQLLCLAQLYFLRELPYCGSGIGLFYAFLVFISLPFLITNIILLIIPYKNPTFRFKEALYKDKIYQIVFYIMLISTTVVSIQWMLFSVLADTQIDKLISPYVEKALENLSIIYFYPLDQILGQHYSLLKLLS